MSWLGYNIKYFKFVNVLKEYILDFRFLSYKYKQYAKKIMS